MDILGVGFPELILILIIAMMIFGPRRLPEIASKAGKIVRDLRSMSQGLLLEWQREIAVASRLDDLEETKKELAELKKELGETQRAIGQQAQKSVKQLEENISAEMSSAENTLKSVASSTSTDGSPPADSDQSGEDVMPEITPEEKPLEVSKADSEFPHEQDVTPDISPAVESTNLASSHEPEPIVDSKTSKTVKANGRPGDPDEVSNSNAASSSEQPSKPKEALNE